jgi:hypothetical protein
MNTIPVTLEYEMYLNSEVENGDEATGAVLFILSFLTKFLSPVRKGWEPFNRGSKGTAGRSLPSPGQGRG